jgi:3-oxoacyl-[acyl-carrier-protein] synthase-3
MRVDSLYVAGTGRWLPPPVRTEDAVRLGQVDAAAAARTDVVSVTVADTDIAPPEMAARAAATALDRARADAADIGIVLHANVYHQGHHCWAPASYVQRRVLGTRCTAIEVRQASNGGMAALELAAAWLSRSDTGALLTAADRWPMPGFDRWRSDPGTVYADGGAALVLHPSRGFAKVLSLATVSDAGLEAMHRTGGIGDDAGMAAPIPVDLDAAKREFTREAGFSYSAARVKAGQREALKTALADADLELADIDWFVLPHFGRRRLESAYTNAFGISMDRTTWPWARAVGHLGAADQFAGLDHLVTARALRPGQHCLLVGVGSGFTWSAAVLRICRTPDRDGSNRLPPGL